MSPTSDESLVRIHAPWLDQARRELLSYYRSRAPRSLLLIGREGIGKQQLVDDVVQSLFCTHLEQEELYPCGQCQNCRWIAANFHPDIYLIGHDGEIKVDEIRKIHQFSQLTPETGQKIVVIKNAANMNINAANSLLKVLEEPPKDLSFILETDSPDHLPITVRSRCQQYTLETPTLKESIHFLHNHTSIQQLPEEDLQLLLAIAFGAPFLALKLLNSYVENGKNIINIIHQLINGQLPPSKAIPSLLEQRELTFLLLFYILSASFKNTRELFPAEFRRLFDAVRKIEPKKRILQYEKLVEIYRLRDEQTRTDWALDAWFIEFL